jgi:hypothetical protein
LLWNARRERQLDRVFLRACAISPRGTPAIAGCPLEPDLDSPARCAPFGVT